MITKSDDALYGCAQMAESRMVQDLYLDAIHELQAVSSDIENRFIDRFIAQFNQGIPRHIQHKHIFEPNAEQSYSDSCYLRTEITSEDLALCKMIEKTRTECAETLLSLDRRIGLLIRDPDLELMQNPLGPEPICEAFRTAITDAASQLNYGFEIRPVLLNLFDQYVLGNMDAVYKELNLHLIKIGVQPQLQTTGRNPDNDAADLHHQDFPLTNLPVPDPEYTNCFGPAQAADPADSVSPRNGTEGKDQQTANTLPLDQNIIEGTSLNHNAGDITIDVVAMMFERILEDINIAGSMRALLGRLQIPLIKVAILDSHFFSNKNHPARQLLNRLADSAIGWDEHVGNKDPLYRKVDSIVQTILDEFDGDVILFTTLLVDLESFLIKREEQADINIQRSIKVMEGKERNEDARSKAMEQIEPRISSGHHLGFINEFITTHWKDLLFLIGARQGKDSHEWKQAISTMDDLIWSVKPKDTTDERQSLATMQPLLLNRLREGMQRLSVPATEQDEFIAKLMHAHACAFTENTRADQETEPAHFRTGREPGMDDFFTTQARQLEPGTWIELLDSDGKTKRAKLSWMSPITKTYLFTDQKGLHAGNYAIEELAHLLRCARARIVN